MYTVRVEVVHKDASVTGYFNRLFFLDLSLCFGLFFLRFDLGFGFGLVVLFVAGNVEVVDVSFSRSKVRITALFDEFSTLVENNHEIRFG